jgi:hypothetical protein
MSFIPHVISSKNVTVYVDGEQHIVPTGTAQYDLVIKAINAGDVQGVKDAVEVRQAVVKMSQGKIELDGTILKYDGRPLHGALVNRILSVVKGAGNAAPLLMFLDNLMQNPSHRAINELYGFMEACDLPITHDGHFLAYKKVRDDYTSVHDGVTKNNIGLVVEMPRNAVNDNKDETCSTGLHFCSESYLSCFGGTRIVVVKINPADVVSIPSDYNNAKGRACRYLVVGELKYNEKNDDIEKLKANFDDVFATKATPAAPSPLVEDEDDGHDILKAPLAPTSGLAAKQKNVGQSVLTDQQVRDIRQALEENWPLSTIAKTFGIHARTVGRIRDGLTYTHVV